MWADIARYFHICRSSNPTRFSNIFAGGLITPWVLAVCAEMRRLLYLACLSTRFFHGFYCGWRIVVVSVGIFASFAEVGLNQFFYRIEIDP